MFITNELRMQTAISAHHKPGAKKTLTLVPLRDNKAQQAVQIWFRLKDNMRAYQLTVGGALAFLISGSSSESSVVSVDSSTG